MLRTHDGEATTATTTPAPTALTGAATRDLAAKFVAFLETGEPPAGLFAPDMFCDLTLPLWRLQAQGAEDASGLRRGGHPWPGRVPRSRLDLTETGFVIEVEEEWENEGQTWCCREMMRADVSPDGITQLSVYCTGDWDTAQVARHASEVTLIRP
jgi:hypothetical protein